MKIKDLAAGFLQCSKKMAEEAERHQPIDRDVHSDLKQHDTHLSETVQATRTLFSMRKRQSDEQRLEALKSKLVY